VSIASEKESVNGGAIASARPEEPASKCPQCCDSRVWVKTHDEPPLWVAACVWCDDIQPLDDEPEGGAS
jgi:hypothetical protein